MIYLDLLMVQNFLADFLLLLASQRLSGYSGKEKRLLAGAALGAVYSGSCFLPGFSFLAELHWQLIALVLMCLVSFGWGKSSWRRSGTFLLLSMALGGLSLRMSRESGRWQWLSPVLLWLLIAAAFGGRAGQKKLLPLEIPEGERVLRLTALVDSGNGLRDPVSGESVLVVGPEEAEKLTGLGAEALDAPMDTLAGRNVQGLRLIPYRTVGGSGMLLAKRYPGIRLGGQTRSMLVAFAPHHLGDGTYQALTAP